MDILVAVGRSVLGGRRLRGRQDECAVLGRLLDEARGGRSGALLLEGEAGVGKTALLAYAIAAGCAVAALLYALVGFWCLAIPVVVGAAAALMRIEE